MCYDGPDGAKTILCWRLTESMLEDGFDSETIEEHIAKLLEDARKHFGTKT